MNKTITPSRFRLAVQALYTLFCIYIGVEFARFVAWATGTSDVFVAKPGAVEGFLPISALLGLRQWLSSGQWDAVHPAGLTILLALLVMSFLFRKGFCGYICPVGFISSLLERAGRKIGMAYALPPKTDYPLMAVKYALAGFFLYTVFLAMDTASIGSFITSPYNMVADAKMLAFFTSPSPMSLMIIGVLVILSLVVRNFWCRYLCPYGALLGVFSWFSPSAVRRDVDSCIDCGKCARTCPSGISVDRKKTVRTPECIGCAECVGACPVSGCLSFTAMGKRIPWLAIGVGAVAVLLAFWLWAMMTGHWDANIPAPMLKRFYSSLLVKG